MKTIKIPKFFHELFGKETTVIELSLTLAFTVLSTMLLLTKTYSEWQGFQIYQIAIISMLALDINGGLIANITFSTNNLYKESAKARIIFIATHIQPLILAFVFRSYYLPCIFTWVYTVISASIVNKYYNHPAQRTIGFVFIAFGLLCLILFVSNLPKLLFSLLVFYLIKVSFSFAVNHYLQREA